MQPRYWVRAFVNIINCSTLLGLIAAAVGRAHLTRGHHGLILGWGYRFRIPPRRTPAFTLGNVVLLRHEGPDILQRRPRLLVHEERHATQYAYCLGVVMVVLYLLASAWSWLRTGDSASRNVFERLAGLADGGYTEHPVRPLFRRSRAVRPPADVQAAPEATAMLEGAAAPEGTALAEPTTDVSEATAVPETTTAPEPTALPEPTTNASEATAVPETTTEPEPTAVAEAPAMPETATAAEPTAVAKATAVPETATAAEPTAVAKATAMLEATAASEVPPAVDRRS